MGSNAGNYKLSRIRFYFLNEQIICSVHNTLKAFMGLTKYKICCYSQRIAIQVEMMRKKRKWVTNCTLTL